MGRPRLFKEFTALITNQSSAISAVMLGITEDGIEIVVLFLDGSTHRTVVPFPAFLAIAKAFNDGN